LVLGLEEPIDHNALHRSAVRRARHHARSAVEKPLARAASAVDSGAVVEYSLVTTDADGNQVVVASGEYTPGGDNYDVGQTVVLKGSDGVERSWTIVRKAPVAYAGMTFFVEPAE
jgi:hypothetical protein